MAKKNESTKVTDQLKQLQADALTYYVKLHNYHWHISGMQFYPIHEMTQKLYEEVTELYDDCAERCLQLGVKPYVTMSEILAETRIKEEKKLEFSAKEVLEGIMADSLTFHAAFKELSKSADEAGDSATAAFADEQIAKIEKQVWMLKSALA